MVSAKPSKCQIVKPYCQYLRHLIGGELKPLEAKVEALKKYPKPCKKREMKEFLGLANYYRKFFPTLLKEQNF